MADKKIRKFSKTNRRRLLVVFLFVLICFVLLVVRLVQINVKNGTDYEKNVLSLACVLVNLALVVNSV